MSNCIHCGVEGNICFHNGPFTEREVELKEQNTDFKEGLKRLRERNQKVEEENKRLTKKNLEMKKLLLKAGATSHRLEDLHLWYCENSND